MSSDVQAKMFWNHPHSVARASRGFETLEQETCRRVNSFTSPEAKCDFIRNNSICEYDGFVVSYLELTFCDFAHSLPKVLLVLGIILFVYFLIISIVADDFLCPCLLTMSKTLRMPDNIAGVTFLAFGNGAPDIFASIGGITHSKTSLIFASLYGGGIFVTTIVTGIVLLTGDFGVMKRPILRDITFYICATFLVWVFIYFEKITIYHSISLVIFYICYILVLIASRYIYLRRSKKSPTNMEINPEANQTSEITINIELDQSDNRSIKSINSAQTASRKHSDASGVSYRFAIDPKVRATSYDDSVILTRFYRRGTLRTPRRKRSKVHVAHHHFENTLNHISRIYENERKQGVVEDVRYRDRIQDDRPDRIAPHSNEIKFTNNFGRPKYLKQFSSQSFFSLASSDTFLNMRSETRQFLIHVSPIDYIEWHQFSLFKKICDCIKAVPYLILTICIPVVDLESPQENWCRFLACINVVFAPLAVVFLLQLPQSLGPIPLWSISLMVSTVLVIGILVTSSSLEAPIYHRAFSFVGFIISVIFINSIVTEIISILETLGILFDLSDSILGLTILAWGNSLGDIVSDLAMARNGYPGMAIAACFGSPMLNLLMGLGIPYTIMFAQGKRLEVVVINNHMITLLYTTITTALCCSFLAFILTRFRSTRWHGIFLIFLYVVYFVLAILLEFDAIPTKSSR